MRRAGSRSLRVLAPLLALAALLGPVRHAGAAPAAACADGQGITVVVDFGPLGGGTQVRCVTGPVSSGFDALRQAGFTFSGTQQFPGLLCRIDGQPADQLCVGAPPSTAYWAYWTADQPGGRWAYSSLGAGNRVPPQGSMEGWAFSSPCRRAPEAPSPCSTTTTTPAPPTTTPPVVPAPAAPRTGSAGGGTVPPEAPPATPAVEGPASSTSTTADEGVIGAAPDHGASVEASSVGRAPAAGSAGDAPQERTLDDPVTASEPSSAGSPAGVALGGVLVAGLGAGAVLRARRRQGEV